MLKEEAESKYLALNEFSVGDRIIKTNGDEYVVCEIKNWFYEKWKFLFWQKLDIIKTYKIKKIKCIED